MPNNVLWCFIMCKGHILDKAVLKARKPLLILGLKHKWLYSRPDYPEVTRFLSRDLSDRQDFIFSRKAIGEGCPSNFTRSRNGDLPILHCEMSSLCPCWVVKSNLCMIASLMSSDQTFLLSQIRWRRGNSGVGSLTCSGFLSSESDIWYFY